ncbi:unnamed protein product [Echinostoma caproni]|uniref:ADP-ribosylation factor-like protein 13B n=1 Tax=Echinostoma caproni TaxID=27848 RepID=A0A183AVY9_9TREM|nr:unnamed protein product [Echinostoma caproni]
MDNFRLFWEVYLVILGLDNAGKTTTTRSIKGVSSDLVAPTIGFDRIEFAVDRFNINLYDLGGGRTIRDIWQTYFAEIHGVIFVVDSSAPERLEECQTVLGKLFAHPSISGKPVLLLANKQDVEEAMDEADLIHALQLDYLANEYRCPCRLERCCALLRPGKKLDKAIRTGLRWLLAYIESEWDTLDQRIRTDVARQTQEQALEREARRERVRLVREKRERLERERAVTEAAAATSNRSVVDSVRENGFSKMDQGDASLTTIGSESVGKPECVRENEKHLIQPQTVPQVGPLTPAPSNSASPSVASPVHQPVNRTNNRNSFDFTSAPEPILVRESAFTPKSTGRPSVSNARSLMNSHELRRQIQIACSIDLNPTAGQKHTLDHHGETIKIEELDETEEGISSVSRNDEPVHLAGNSPSRNGQENDPVVVTKMTPSADRCVSVISVKDETALNPFGEHGERSETVEPQTTQTSLDSVHEECHKTKTGIIPPMVDTLYGKKKQSISSIALIRMRMDCKRFRWIKQFTKYTP